MRMSTIIYQVHNCNEFEPLKDKTDDCVNERFTIMGSADAPTYEIKEVEVK